jgi:hypothetical protein
MNLFAYSSSDIGAAIFGSIMTITVLMAWSKVSSDNTKSEQWRVRCDADKYETDFKQFIDYPKTLAAEKQKFRELAQKNPKYYIPVIEELRRRGINPDE